MNKLDEVVEALKPLADRLLTMPGVERITINVAPDEGHVVVTCWARDVAGKRAGQLLGKRAAKLGLGKRTHAMVGPGWRGWGWTLRRERRGQLVN
jgi:hypothetical protein